MDSKFTTILAMMMKSNSLIFSLIAIVSFAKCQSQEYSDKSRQKIYWVEVSRLNDHYSDCRIELLSDKKVLFCSKRQIFSGSKVLILDSISQEVFIEENSTITFGSTTADSVIVFREKNSNSRQKERLILSVDLGVHWDTINIPLINFGRLILNDSLIMVQGNQNGQNAIYYSYDFGLSWEKLDMFLYGYKSFYILDVLSESNTILCNASKDYSSRNMNSLVSLSMKDFKVETLIPLNDNVFLPSISKEDVFLVSSSNRLLFYRFNKQDKKFELISDIKKGAINKLIRNVYVDDSYVITTSRDEGNIKQDKSWITYNGGNTWLPFEQERGFRLIQNSEGQLFCIDQTNRIYTGTSTTLKVK